jgi:hypothetical protein
MTFATKNPRQINAIAIVIFGVLFIVGSFVCLFAGFASQDEYDRWQAVPPIREMDELATVAQDSDVAVVGVVAPWTPQATQGLAMYEYWEAQIKQSGSQKRRVWTMTNSYRPDFELLLGDEAISILSSKASLGNTREVTLSANVTLKGLAPGDQTTVLGTLASSDKPFKVQAQAICGGSKEACVERYAKGANFGGIVAAIALLIGGVLVWVGIRQLRRLAASRK